MSWWMWVLGYAVMAVLTAVALRFSGAVEKGEENMAAMVCCIWPIYWGLVLLLIPGAVLKGIIGGGR